MPLTVDLLYLVGLALGSDEMAGLLHASLAMAVTTAAIANPAS